MICAIGERTKQAYKVEPKLTYEQWAAKNVYFTGTLVSPIPGAFNINKSPHFKKLFQLLDRPQTLKLFGKWASQSGKSLFTVIALGYKLDTDPALVIYSQPIKVDIPKIIDTKLNPVFKSMPKLWKKFQDYKALENERGKQAIKKVPGGMLVVLGSDTKSRKSLTTPYLVMDEIAEFDKGAVEEFSERTKSFSKFFPKIIGVSTIERPDDEICTSYDGCEIRIQWQYICPDCSKNFYPDADYFKYTKKAEYMKLNDIYEEEFVESDYMRVARKSAHVKCPHCSFKIDSQEKDSMIFNGGMDWFYEGTDKVFTVDDMTDERSFGVDMNSLGSFFAIYDDMVEKEVKAQGNEILLDKLYRGWYNKFYEVKGSKINENDLLLLENDYKSFEIPEDTVALYMGVDVQKDHFWIVIEAFTFGMQEAHTIYAGRKDEWMHIVEFMEQVYYYKDGSKYGKIKRMAIDMQGYSKDIVDENELSGEDEIVTLVDRPLETRKFIYEMSKTWTPDQYGLERIYGVRGSEFTHSGDYGEPFNTKVTIKGSYKEQDDRTIKALKVGTIACKLNFMQAVSNTMLMKKGDEAFSDDSKPTLQYFNKDIAKTTKEYRNVPKTAYVMQISAEEYGYWKDGKGKPKKYKSMRKKVGYPRNDYLDCHGYIRALAIMDNVPSMKKPVKKAKKFSVLKSLKG